MSVIFFCNYADVEDYLANWKIAHNWHINQLNEA